MNSLFQPTVIALASLLLIASPESAGELARAKTDPALTAQQRDSIAQQAKQLHAAAKQNQTLPLVSQTTNESTEIDPYAIQKEFVKLKAANDPIIGFKAGLTSTAGQKKFGVDGPLTGVLFKSGVFDSSKPIRLSQFGKLMLETEFGFRVNQTISAPIESNDQLMTKVASVVAVIELPDLRYSDLSKLTGFDLIASNVASAGIILGDSLEFSQLGTHPDITDINQVAVSLSLQNQSNGLKLVNQGMGTDALNDQWSALRFLINQVVSQGYTITPDHILITGALGRMIPAEIGDYRAQFGPLQSIEFAIKP